MQVLHSGNIGDCIASLFFVRRLVEVKGEPLCYLLRVGSPGVYAGDHPSGLSTLSLDMANALLPLLSEQPYIANARLWKEGDWVDYPLDLFRGCRLDQSRTHLARLYHAAFPTIDYDLSPCLSVAPSPVTAGRVVVNRSARYHNPHISYSCLRCFDPLFIGLPCEHSAFEAAFFPIEFAAPIDFLWTARLIAGCRVFVGNQSACWWISQALGVRRVLEVYPLAPNSAGFGLGAFEAWTQSAFEAILHATCQGNAH